MSTEKSFLKMHGAGNDFIVIDDMRIACDSAPRFIVDLCDRHRGIGADGLILIQPSRKAEFRMRYYNSDGKEARMCGNGARCAARFARESGLAGERMRIETGAGVVEASIEGELVTIDFGGVTELRLDVTVPEIEHTVDYALSGVPHAVLFVADVRAMERESLLGMARAVRHFEGFGPEGSNVDFVQVTGPGTLVYRTYERGVEDETLACGTGAIAISVIAAHRGLTASPVRCVTSGGDVLIVGFELRDDGAARCTLSGPATVSFSGVFDPARYGGGTSCREQFRL